MSKQFQASYVWSGLAVFGLTILGEGYGISNALKVLEDLRPATLFKYALPSALTMCGACLFAMRRRGARFVAFTERAATAMLGAWGGIASALTGWMFGVAAIGACKAPEDWLLILATTSVGLVVFLSPWHMLSQALDTLDDFQSRIMDPPWKRTVAATGGFLSMALGVYAFALSAIA